MNFLAPWALWFGAIAPLIVLLYLLKLRRRPLQVSTLLFWQRVLEENRRTALFQRLRNFLSLLLHLLIFALILLALAKPVFDRVIRQGASTILVVDTRARMQALDAQGTPAIERALRMASEYAGQAADLRDAAIVTAGPTARVLAPFSGDAVQLRRTLQGLSPTDAGGELQPALDLANDLLASRAGAKRIILLTTQQSIARKAASAETELRIPPLGTPADNVAITRFAARPIPASTDTSEVLLTVQNFGRAEFVGNVEISNEGALLDVRPFRIPPGQEETVVFPSVLVAKQQSNRGLLTARIDHADPLSIDNLAYAVLPIPETRRVLLVSEGNWFLEKLLAADTRISFEMLAPTAFRPGMAEQFDTTIFDRVLPEGISLDSIPGNALFIRQSPLTTTQPEIEQPLVSEIDEAHPALRMVSLRNITIGRAAIIAVPAGADAGWRWQTPVRSFEQPLLVTGERTRAGKTQRIAVLAFDLTASDLPLRIAFPLLMGNLVQWSAGEGIGEFEPTVQAGETKDFPTPVAVRGPLRDPAKPLTAEPAQTRSFAPLHNGFYQITANDRSTWIAVNTFDTAESNLAAASQGAVASPAPAAPLLLAATRGWPLWRFLALGALALLLVEWWLFHRRRTE